MKAQHTCILLFLLATTTIGCKENQAGNDYLKKVLANLEKIESATYCTTGESWQHGDTVPLNRYQSFIKEYNNPMDSTIGASFVNFNADDTTKATFVYDGKVRAMLNHDEQRIVIDDFTARPLPFRPMTPPFFNYTKNIIHYILTTGDSITVESEEFRDHHYFKLTIHEDRQVEFFGAAHYMPENPYTFGDNTSIYELWISKKNHLPYKVRREMSHNIGVTICHDAQLNKGSINDFNLYDYFPAGYETRAYRSGNSPDRNKELIGTPAPGWTLNDMHETPVSLSELKSKIILLTFTGIGCGPCQMAIPFLKEVRNSYNKDDVELVAIESWVRKPHSLQNYSKKNDLNYPLLSATDEVITDYRTISAPVFFILDEQRTIKNVFTGYAKDKTDEEIKAAIQELL